MNKQEMMAAIESILFVAGDAVTIAEIAQAMNISQLEISIVIQDLMDSYGREQRGLCIRRVDDKIQMGTNPAYASIVEDVLAPAKKYTLSQAALETLSIVAYRQPITRMEIEQIRGVRCEYVVHFLQRNGLIQEVGRKDALGRPIQYGTTDEFLRCFGLETKDQLPPLHMESMNEDEMEEQEI